MFSTLLRSRRFAPLFWCQFFSAFNDNFVRNMLAMLILFRIGADRAGALVTLAIGIFILPSIVLSALGGELADSHDKALIARRLKFAEIFVQMIAAAGFLFASLPLLYTALFGLGVIAALFGPIKYGILPDHLETAELPAGNALVEAATFLAILLGLSLGAGAADDRRARLLGREPLHPRDRCRGTRPAGRPQHFPLHRAAAARPETGQAPVDRRHRHFLVLDDGRHRPLARGEKVISPNLKAGAHAPAFLFLTRPGPA